jgi:hypothetical protein
MFSPSAISVESDYKRQEMLRKAEQHRLIRETKQTGRRSAKKLLALNTLLTAVQPTR